MAPQRAVYLYESNKLANKHYCPRFKVVVKTKSQMASGIDRCNTLQAKSYLHVKYKHRIFVLPSLEE